MTKQTYTVVSEVHHDGDVYPPGAGITLDTDAAAPLIEVGAVREDGVSIDDVRKVIAGLDPDAKVWTKDGRPQIRVLESVLEREISAELRDAAWTAHQAAQGGETGETEGD